MRLRIVSMPTPSGQVMGQDLRVECVETGERLDGVQSIALVCDGRQEPVRVAIVLRDVEISLNMDVPDPESALIRLLKPTKMLRRNKSKP